MPALPERIQTAMALRDHGVALVDRAGVWTKCGPGRVRTATLSDLTVALRTPFQWSPPDATPQDHAHAIAKQRAAPTLAYGLDIWVGGTKVFSVQWADDRTAEMVAFRVISFRRGEWERMLTAAG
jgi:hypothetical protein